MMSLPQKLQIKPGKKWLIYNPPAGYLASLSPLPEGVICTQSPIGKFDGIQLFAKYKTELSTSLEVVIPLLRPDTIFWVTYPKRASGIQSDLKMESWDELNAIGLQGVASISVDKTWAGSRFRPRGQSKISGTAKRDIRKNEFAAFIDVDKKIVTLPPDILRLLQQNQMAFNFYEQLSYSNKKEYLLWILTAKQEQTRIDRMARMIKKLTAAKKNPAEK